MKEILEILMRIVLIFGSVFVLGAMLLTTLIFLEQAIKPEKGGPQDELVMRIINGFMAFPPAVMSFMTCLGLYTFIFNWSAVIQKMLSGF